MTSRDPDLPEATRLGHPRITSEEIDRRGEALYEQSIRPQVETEANIEKMVIIDVETGDYEIDTDGLAASDRLLARHPDAALYGQRIGYDAVYSFDGVLTRTKQ
jgi:hypothetical protein